MNLDDRLRGTYRRQLDDVRERVEESRFEPARSAGSNRRRPVSSVGLATVAAVVVVIGSVGVGRLLDSLEPAAETAATSSSGHVPDDADDGSPTHDHSSPGSSTPPSSSPSSAPSTPLSTVAADADPVEIAPVNPTETDTTSGQELASGVANEVCPSGFRAELERADLRYLGDNRGWERKNDLTDEQDGPFYFTTWEPNYELPVTVEVVLDQPVSVLDLRVHQDPFTAVSGVISIDAADRQISVELSGTDGWRVHTFDEPTPLDRFTIRRDQREANVVEVLVCVDPGETS